MSPRHALGGGVLLALAAVWLLGASRRQTRPARWGGHAGALIGSRLGRMVGRQLGSHPLWAVRLLRRAVTSH